MRLFVGIEFPEEVVYELLRVQHKLHSITKRGRFVPKANLHLTLQFLGEVSEQEFGTIVQALQKSAQYHNAFLLRLKCVGSFSNKAPFRVVWVGIDGDIPRLTNLQKELSISLTAAGFLQEKRSYQPHITLGRDVEFIEKASFEKYSQALVQVPFLVDQFSLMESKIESGRLVYRSLYSFPLGCNDDANF